MLNKYNILIFLILNFATLIACHSPSQVSQTEAPQPECLKQQAAIDIGSGSSKFLIAQVDECQKRIEKIIHTDYKALKFKEALQKNQQQIPAPLIEQAVQSLSAWKSLAAEKKVSAPIHAVATEVFRQAQNGTSVIKQLKKQTDIDIKIIDQEKEALLGFWSALSRYQKPASKVMVWDIGGGSMQMTTLTSLEKYNFYKGTLASVSFKEKVLSLMNKNEDSPNPLGKKWSHRALNWAKEFAQNNVPSNFKKSSQGKSVLGIGGVHSKSIMKNLKLNKQQSHYTQQDLLQAIEQLQNKTDAEIGGEYAETEVTNIILVLAFMQALDIDKVEVIPVNLSEGLIYQHLKSK